MIKEKKSLTHDTIMKTLDWSYDKALNGGIPGMDTAIELADSYMKKGGSVLDNSNSLIKWQNTKSATAGFLTSLGGILTLPVAIPANLASVLLVQVRMIAAIAHMGGYDLKDDQVKTLVFTCLAGNSAKEIIKNSGIQFGRKLAISGIKKIPFTTITKINRAVGFRLITKFGGKGIINLGKIVPIAGGILRGTLDAVSTNIIGKTAQKLFINGSLIRENNDPTIIDMS